MYLFIILLQPAILWIILYYVIGENEVQAFRPLALTFLLISIASAFLSNFLNIYPPLVTSVVFVLTLIIFYRISIVKSLITTATFFAVISGISFIEKILTGN